MASSSAATTGFGMHLVVLPVLEGLSDLEDLVRHMPECWTRLRALRSKVLSQPVQHILDVLAGFAKTPRQLQDAFLFDLLKVGNG